MIEIELEKTYLIKQLPKDLESFPHKEILDLYIPASSPHPKLRIRKNGNNYEITKKHPIKDGDVSEQEEHTVRITESEYFPFTRLESKRLRKIRYDYDYKGFKAEIAIFKDELEGLVMVDFEFKTRIDMNQFQMPDYCLVDVTQDETFAGGILCGKRYTDIEIRLNELGYKKILK